MIRKLNAEELAKKYAIEQGAEASAMWHEGCAFAIAEVAQPIADERDELRKVVADLLAWNERNPMGHGSIEGDMELEVVLDNVRAILAKYPKP